MKNNAKFSGHYVCPRTETVREHALRSHQFIIVNQQSVSDWTYIFISSTAWNTKLDLSASFKIIHLYFKLFPRF